MLTLPRPRAHPDALLPAPRSALPASPAGVGGGGAGETERVGDGCRDAPREPELRSAGGAALKGACADPPPAAQPPSRNSTAPNAMVSAAHQRLATWQHGMQHASRPCSACGASR